MKAWKVEAYKQANKEVVALEDEGHMIERLTDYHWRINGLIDVWPSSKKYQKAGRVRTYKKLKEVLT